MTLSIKSISYFINNFHKLAITPPKIIKQIKLTFSQIKNENELTKVTNNNTEHSFSMTEHLTLLQH